MNYSRTSMPILTDRGWVAFRVGLLILTAGFLLAAYVGFLYGKTTTRQEALDQGGAVRTETGFEWANPAPPEPEIQVVYRDASAKNVVR